MNARTALFLTMLCVSVAAAAQHHEHQGMQMDRNGAVMNENADRLPSGCDAVSGDHSFTIHAGSRYASGRPGVIFGLSEHEVRVPPCSRVTVRFVNEDEIRHQWMVHGLPKYLYPAGMFHIEAMGGAEQIGTFIVPPENRTYLVHCDMAQHMEKGMRGQLVVGSGSDIWGVPGISDAFYRFPYLPLGTGLMLVCAVLGSFAATVLWRRLRT